MIREWFQRWWRWLFLSREEYLELHILEFASRMDRDRINGMVPDLKGYSRAEIDAKTQDLFGQGMLRPEANALEQG